MKKLLLIFSLLFAAKSFAQYPLVQGLGNDSTLIKVGQNYKGGIKGGLINMSVADTTAANLLRIKAYPGAQIYTDDGSVWIRNITATGWSLLGGGVSPSGSFWAIGGNLFPVTVPSRNIGTLSPYGGAIGLMTNSVVHAIVPDAGFSLSNDTTSTKVFTYNPTSKEWGYANWNNGGGGTGGGGIGSFEDSVANVRYFGAVGDGVTEDSAAFKAAVATGRDVYVPKGTYKITAINISPVWGQTIFGDGENTKIITAQTNGAIFKVVNPNVKFMNLTFEGSGKTSSLPGQTVTTYQTGIWVVINSTTITNCTFRRFNGRGVYIFHPSAAYIMNNTVINNRFFQNTVGLESDYGADYLLVANNSLDTNYACIVEGGNANVYYLGNQATQSTFGYYSYGGAAHGSIVGGSFNHCTTGMRIPSGQQGMTVTDTKFWYSDIVLGSSDTVSRVSFYNCVVEGSNVTLTKAKNNKWVGGYIYGSSANVITGTGLTFENVITAPAGLNETYTKITSTDSSFTTKNGLNIGRGIYAPNIPTFTDTTSFKPLVINGSGTVYKATYWPGGGGGGWGTTGTVATLTGASTLDANGFAFNISNLDNSDFSPSGEGLSFTFGSTNDFGFFQVKADSVRFPIQYNSYTNDTTTFKPVAIGPTGKIVRLNRWAGSGSYTAGSGLTLSGSEFKLGGNLTEDFVLNANGYDVYLGNDPGGNARNIYLYGGGFISLGSDSVYIASTPSGSSTDSVLVINNSTGLIRKRNASAFGGSGSPAGNFGNLQIGRNGAFATPASDSLDFESATGLSVKGNVNVTGLINAADGSSGNPSITFSTSDNEGFWLNGTGNLVMSNQNQNIWQTNTAAMRIKSTIQLSFSSGDPTTDGADVGITRDAAGVLRVTNGSTGVGDLKAKGVTWSGRVLDAQGADVASSAGAISLGSDGNSFEITGTAAITLISNTNWQNGSEVTLLFTSTATLTDGTANSGTDIGMELAGNTNFTGSAGATLTLILSEIGGTQRWREKCRSVN